MQFRRTSPSSSKIRPGIYKDWTLLVLSLCIAAAVWFIDKLAANYTQPVSVEITLRSDISGHREESANSQILTARVTSTGFELLRIGGRNHRKIKLTLPSSSLKSLGGENYALRSTSGVVGENASLIFGEKSRVEYFIEDTLVFRFPFETNKKVPVDVVAQLDFKSQYTSPSGVVTVPDSVIIYGSPDRLASIERVSTTQLRLGRLDSPQRGSVALKKIQGVRFSAGSVDYKIDVLRYVEVRRELKVVPSGVPEDVLFSIYPPTVEVDFRCAYPMMASEELDKLRLVVRYSDYLSTVSGKCVPVFSKDLPDGVFKATLRTDFVDCFSEQKTRNNRQ